MLLIADSGSTKTDWAVLDGGRVLFETSTVGLNPVFVSKQEIRNVLRGANFFTGFDRKIGEVRFFGAGCGNEEGKKKMEGSLKAFFKKAKVYVQSDLMAAAVATCGNKEGIVCILGTGSNC